MKQRLLTLLTALLLLCGCDTKSQSPQNLDVMSFNIRLDAAVDSLNNWQYRKENVVNSLEYYSPDVIGMQEVLHNQLVFLRDNLVADYSYVGVGRADGKEAGEYAPIFYKHQLFELVSSGTFALSETPEKIGSMGWDAACERIVTYAILKFKTTGGEIAVFNTHFDHVGDIARAESSKLIHSKIKELAPSLPVVLLGDFNLTPDSRPIQLLIEGGLSIVSDCATIKYGAQWSFHDFGRVPLEQRPLIDHIFINDSFIALKYRSIEDLTAQGFLSDHCPVSATLQLKGSY